ncbi:MAG: MBL fold metallo-hydrolase [Vicinamibacterales bacterium]
MTVVPIHAGNPGPMTGSGNWTYLLPGARPVLVDAGVGRAEHLDALAAQVPGGPDRVLVTHAHPDHASGAPALARRFPAARFLKWPWPERDPAAVAWAALAAGEVVETDQGPLTVVHTPGHSPDHVVLWHRDSGTAFTGDLLVAGSTVVIPASRGGRLSDYLRSLATVASLELRRALPAHGPPIEDPAALIASYVTHRQFRERQVVDALRAGVGDPAVIAAGLYDGLDPALRPMAEESVLAHLVKLADEGRAVVDGDTWRLVG